MKAGLFAVAIGCAVALGVFGSRITKPPVEVVAVANPCSTFVSQFGPDQTPRFKSTPQGASLLVSFTPARDPEVDAVVDGVERGAKRLKLKTDGSELRILGHETGGLLFAVADEADARWVLDKLCFRPTDVLHKADAPTKPTAGGRA